MPMKKTTDQEAALRGMAANSISFFKQIKLSIKMLFMHYYSNKFLSINYLQF